MYKLDYRRFEWNSSYPMPSSIKDLSDGLFNYIFPFHYFVFPIGHFIPGLSEWIRVSQKEEPIYLHTAPYLSVFISFKIIYLKKFRGRFWEPELVLHKSDPLHYEGFLMCFRDQAALSLELCRANYSFLIASHIFSVHDGIKLYTPQKQNSRLRSPTAESNAIINRFYAYLDNKYPATRKKCYEEEGTRLLLDLPYLN